LVRLPKSAKQKILVVGGAGQMGRWLCRYFRSRGYDVIVNDIAGPLEDFPFEPDLAKGVLAANVVAVAVPMSVCADILNRIAAIKPRALIFDVASLKAPIERELRAMGHAGLRGDWPSRRRDIQAPHPHPTMVHRPIREVLDHSQRATEAPEGSGFYHLIEGARTYFASAKPL